MANTSRHARSGLLVICLSRCFSAWTSQFVNSLTTQANSARSFSNNDLDDARGIDLPWAFFFIKVGPFHHSGSPFRHSRFPFRHFSEGRNPEIQSAKHGPPLFSEGDEGGGRLRRPSFRHSRVCGNPRSNRIKV